MSDRGKARKDSQSTGLKDVAYAAQRLGVDNQRIYRLIKAEELPGVVRLGRQVRIDAAKLEEWIEQGGTG